MKLALIGATGHFALTHARKDPSSGIEPTIAVASDGHNPQGCQQMAQRLGNARYYDDYRVMLDEFRPDIVNIGAIYGHNGEVAADVIGRDIPVVCEKPLAATWEQFHRIIELSRWHASPIITELTMRSQRDIRAARQAVRQGRIGKVVLATGQKSYRFGQRPAWYARREDFAGLMMWVASHAIDCIRFCTGDPIRRVIGVQGNLSKPDFGQMEDHCVALLELAGGASAIAHADFLRPESAPTHGDDRLRIAGSQGVVEVMGGRCALIDASGPRDITEDVQVQPPWRELLNAALRGDESLYGTKHSLEMAAVLLHARDAADAREWREIG
jgi:predicted dehydrogenase